MRKFEELSLAEQTKIKNFLNTGIECYTEEKHYRNVIAEFRGNSIDIKPDFDIKSQDEIDYYSISVYSCIPCKAIIGKKDLIEHIMIHLEIE
jgi:hypothetical protein